MSQTSESTESAQVHFLSSKNIFLGTECVLEKGMCFRVHVVHSSELMLFSGLFASLIFHPTAEWKQHQRSQDRQSQESGL